MHHVIDAILFTNHVIHEMHLDSFIKTIHYAMYYLSPLTGEMTSSIHENKRMCKFSSDIIACSHSSISIRGPIICQEQSDTLKANERALKRG